MNPILQLIADNQGLADALKEALESELDTMPEGPEGFSDERLGQIARARISGQKAIRDTFKKIARLKSGAPRVEQSNPAR